VLATTNHPGKLDPAILDRPSRFDRKYHFQLPAGPERLAYIMKWNSDLQLDLQVSENGAAEVVNATEGFSFAYLKELFVTSMVQWMSEGRSTSMDDILLAQTALLRGQMKIKKGNKVKD
jgi:ATP-dependent 26S proteasome regulatory subunit